MINLNWKISCLLAFSLLCCNTSYALQAKHVSENETVNVQISATDVTRIFIKEDRIKSVRGVKGAYSRENDEKNGEIYIQPTQFYQHRSFTMLIHTEKGHHFTLLVTPTFSPSEPLMLIPKGIGKEDAKNFETASSYELTVTHLMKSMKNQIAPSGYAVHEISNPKHLYQFKSGLRLKLKMIYEGLSLRGEIYQITNKSNSLVYLDEHEFYRSKTRAISIDQIYIAPKQSIYLYRIMSHE